MYEAKGHPAFLTVFGDYALSGEDNSKVFEGSLEKFGRLPSISRSAV
jgi:hypothetical protein